MVTPIVKWVSLPVLLAGSMLSRFAVNYELLLDLVICVGAIVVVDRAIRVREYLWAAAFVVIAILFSPLLPVIKIFLWMGFTCIATFVTLISRAEDASIVRCLEDAGMPAMAENRDFCETTTIGSII